MSEWGERIKQRREGLGMSKAKLARACRVSGATVNDWENGDIKAINGENLLRAADALRCTPYWLMTGTERHTDAARYAPPSESFSAAAPLVQEIGPPYLSDEHHDLLTRWDRLPTQSKTALNHIMDNLRHA